MIIEIIIPTPGESISEVELANWMVENGDYVEKDQEIAEIESDKATLPLIASNSGKLKILVEQGSTVKVGTVACTIDTEAQVPEKKGKEISKTAGNNKTVPSEKIEDKPVKNAEKQETNPEAGRNMPVEPFLSESDTRHVKVTPLAKNLMDEESLNLDDILAGLKKITTKEVYQVIEAKDAINIDRPKIASREVQTEKMSQLRKKLSQRLVNVKNETAMLTTFNEADMSAVIALREKYQKQFTEKHGIKLGFMSIFIKAASEALLSFPKVNSMLDGDSIITPGYTDIAFAVQTDKGLMVPVIRNTESKSLAEIENSVSELARKARSFRLTIEEMSGGTFTITNGGIFGSMLSTPIINAQYC
jgi:2-oxoglutarate dehydrogenase E2 component (dihydrolipoamide succinyltransferase)